jgi:hypothetical protein
MKPLGPSKQSASNAYTILAPKLYGSTFFPRQRYPKYVVRIQFSQRNMAPCFFSIMFETFYQLRLPWSLLVTAIWLSLRSSSSAAPVLPGYKASLLYTTDISESWHRTLGSFCSIHPKVALLPRRQPHRLQPRPTEIMVGLSALTRQLARLLDCHCF